MLTLLKTIVAALLSLALGTKPGTTIDLRRLAITGLVVATIIIACVMMAGCSSTIDLDGTSRRFTWTIDLDPWGDNHNPTTRPVR